MRMNQAAGNNGAVVIAQDIPKLTSLGPFVVVNLLMFVLVPAWLLGFFNSALMKTWTTVFLGTTVEAVPFLALGAVVSAVMTAFVSPAALSRLLPRNTAMAVPVAGLAGALLPGCECASVPIAANLVGRGVTPAVALTFLLSAPAINPLVLISTSVAFPGHPAMVAARFLASLVTSVVVGWIWVALGRSEWIRIPHRPNHHGVQSWRIFATEAQHDFLQGAGFLTIGAAAAATLNVVVPHAALTALSGNALISILVLAILAVGLAICSEADAFVAASLFQFSTTARLAFMVVGPAIDLKLMAMQSGAFGRRFVMHFAPLSFAAAVISSIVFGGLLL
jgi:uncharacterized membrane protein YraQ (UPF0718 family)